MPEKELRGIVRIAGTDLKGENQLFTSLQRIKGVSFSLANVVCKICNFERNRKIGTLTDKEVKKIEEVLKKPEKFDVPSWLLNRRKDPETGKDSHLIAHDLTFTQKQDIKKMIGIKSYKGVRHMLGLPVRGQRTKSSFRKGRTVGVVRKKVQPAKKKGKK